MILKVAPPHVDARFWADIGSEQLIGHRIGASVGFMVETRIAPRGAADDHDAVFKSFLRVSDIDQ